MDPFANPYRSTESRDGGLSITLHKSVAEYADALAEFLAAQSDDDDDEQDTADVDEDLPGDVPGRATVTIKTINENRYYYWQWREGEDIKSKYKGPVDADE